MVRRDARRSERREALFCRVRSRSLHRRYQRLTGYTMAAAARMTRQSGPHAAADRILDRMMERVRGR